MQSFPFVNIFAFYKKKIEKTSTDWWDERKPEVIAKYVNKKTCLNYFRQVISMNFLDTVSVGNDMPWERSNTKTNVN